MAVLGGLFDPVHKGHVSAARLALELLGLEQLKMIPCHLPNHKAVPATPADHRLAMLELATASCSSIEVDPIELLKDRVSYTVDTLCELKQNNSPLVFVLGVDSFNSLPEWHDWRRVLELSHLLVVSRHGTEFSRQTLNSVEFDQRNVETAEQLLSSESGKILICEDFDVDTASSEIREKLMRGEDVSSELDVEVMRYISDNGLYRNKQS
ncbi:MAG: putative nicotinate-nucleotide adenylyltransferase [Pseudohongiella sp.]|nr:MAG: putative nicotinate-nucleotide adenylyltransferase [Pseudohongiella sp.]